MANLIIDIAQEQEKAQEHIKEQGLRVLVCAGTGCVANGSLNVIKRFKELGYENLFTINANTLSGFVREAKRENEGVLPEWMQGLINTYEKQSIRIKRN